MARCGQAVTGGPVPDDAGQPSRMEPVAQVGGGAGGRSCGGASRGFGAARPLPVVGPGRAPRVGSVRPRVRRVRGRRSGNETRRRPRPVDAPARRGRDVDEGHRHGDRALREAGSARRGRACCTPALLPTLTIPGPVSPRPRKPARAKHAPGFSSCGRPSGLAGGSAAVCWKPQAVPAPRCALGASGQPEAGRRLMPEDWQLAQPGGQVLPLLTLGKPCPGLPPASCGVGTLPGLLPGQLCLVSCSPRPVCHLLPDLIPGLQRAVGAQPAPRGPSWEQGAMLCRPRRRGAGVPAPPASVERPRCTRHCGGCRGSS